MRSLLFVPGDSERKLERSLHSGADILIVDLEDSVAPARKQAAREIAAGFIRERRRDTPGKFYIRINDLETGLADADLDAVIRAAPDGVMLPKSAGGASVAQLSVKLRVREAEADLADGVTKILPIVSETAAGLLAAGTYGDCPRLTGLTWGAEDLSADIGARTARDEVGRYTDVFRLARSMTLLAAAAAEVAAIDTVFVDFRDEEALRRECLEAERDGFTGKMAIHPDQAPIINEAFTPSGETLEHAQAIVAAFEAADNPGVVGIEGRMYDRPHLRRAERILARGRAAGVIA